MKILIDNSQMTFQWLIYILGKMFNLPVSRNGNKSSIVSPIKSAKVRKIQYPA